MTRRLVVAIPSKGRLQENTAAFLARAGLTLSQEGGSRDYRGAIRDMPGVEAHFLSASEIVAKLASGEAHFGVTGEDLIRESVPDADRSIALLTGLGFGEANVVVAVPKGWIDARTMEDVEEIAADFHARRGRRMRVATKYVNLTRRFFAEHGVADYRIVESLGATEGAPAAGTAEFIVDITTTGSTLEANGLKVIENGVMLRSQANLAASLRADWTGEARTLARAFLGRISAEEAARTMREVRLSADGDATSCAEVAERFGAVQVSRSRTTATYAIAAGAAASLASALIEAGASRAVVMRQDYAFERRTPLDDRLEAALQAQR